MIYRAPISFNAKDKENGVDQARVINSYTTSTGGTYVRDYQPTNDQFKEDLAICFGGNYYHRGYRDLESRERPCSAPGTIKTGRGADSSTTNADKHVGPKSLAFEVAEGKKVESPRQNGRGSFW